MTLKTTKNNASVTDFINTVEDEQKRADCHAIDALCQRITGQPGKMWGSSIVGYGQYSYTRSDGKFYEFLALGFSPRAANLTIYNIPGYEGLPELVAKLGKFTMGKSCLYVKKLADIDVDVLEQILRDGYSQVAGKHLDYKTRTWVESDKSK